MGIPCSTFSYQKQTPIKTVQLQFMRWPATYGSNFALLHFLSITSFFASRCHASAAHVVMRYPTVGVSVCMSVTFVNSVKTNISSKNFHHLVASQVLNVGVKCRWGRQKLRFWAYIWLHCVLSKLRPARRYQHGADGPRSRKLCIAGSKRRSLLIAGDNDEMFLTRSLNITPKTT